MHVVCELLLTPPPPPPPPPPKEEQTKTMWKYSLQGFISMITFPQKLNSNTFLYNWLINNL